jgi:hypothetical protein
LQDLIAAIGIIFFERQFILVLLVYACSYYVLYIAREVAFSGSSWPQAAVLALYTSATIALALAICAHTLRWFAVHRAWQLVSGDKERYDVMWQSMMHKTEYQDMIAAIRSEVTPR